MVIVKSKLSGKFLRNHSGSANNFNGRIRWQVFGDKKFMASLPPKTAEDRKYNADTPRSRAISKEVHMRMYDAEALEARRFASSGSAATSIGKWTGRHYRRGEGHHVIPEHLEIHEIVAGNLCLVSPDDDEETKRRKEKNCK